MASTRTNWAGTRTIAGRRLHEPRSLDELRDVVARSQHLRVLGTGHTFNALPDSRGDLVSLARMPRRIECNGRDSITVDGAARYADVCIPLDAEGFAFEAMASLPHIAVAGACATGTHGSGDRVQSLAAGVAGIELLTADGELLRVDRATGADMLAGMVVSLGALGIVTAVTLDVVPRYEMHQVVYEDVSVDTVLDRFDEITGVADSVSLFTTWHERGFHQVWCKDRTGWGRDPSAAAALLRARPAARQHHPIPDHDASACTPQLGVPGPWHERLPHFRADRTPSSGHELQSEYLVDRQVGPDALRALFEVGPRIAPVLHVSEVRTVAADDRWLSPATGRDTVAFHFTWEPDHDAVVQALGVVERALAPFDARPHWGKLWTVRPAEVAARYPRLPDVARLRDRLDPDRTFANDYVDALLGA